MRGRAFLASLVMAVVVAVCCAGSACSMACGLRTLGPGCHGKAAASMPGMPSMGRMALVAVGVHAADSQARGAACEQEVCAEPPSARTGDVQTAGSGVVLDPAVVAGRIAWSAYTALPGWRSHPPPLPGASPLVRFASVLRV